MDYLMGDLGVPGFSGLREKILRDAVNQFKMRGISLRITPTVKSQIKHYQGIIRRRASEFGLSPYTYALVEAKVKKRFNELHQRLLDENPDTSQLPRVNAFYAKHKTKPELVKCRSKKEIPSELPEESDRMILSEVINYPQSCLLTADCDFYTVDEEISTEFQVFVISQENVNEALRSWAWL
jgi:hypothetical protein